MKRYKPSPSELKDEMINNLIFLQEQKEML